MRAIDYESKRMHQDLECANYHAAQAAHSTDEKSTLTTVVYAAAAIGAVIATNSVLSDWELLGRWQGSHCLL